MNFYLTILALESWVEMVDFKGVRSRKLWGFEKGRGPLLVELDEPYKVALRHFG